MFFNKFIMFTKGVFIYYNKKYSTFFLNIITIWNNWFKC